MEIAAFIASIVVSLAVPILFIGGLVSAMAKKRKLARYMILFSVTILVTYFVLGYILSAAI